MTFSLNKIRSESGFSIIEMVAVIFVINFALVGIVSLAIQSIQIERFNKSILVAAQLAQEGVELIRNQRDNNWIVPSPGWPPANDNYAVDVDINAVGGIASIADDRTKLYTDAEGFYTHDSTGSSTIYRRLVTVNTDPSLATTTIKSQVQFSDGFKVKNYIVETELYDWR
ncbi:hypothetical protein HGA64_03060 [Candidatus Falkowbacteria bacterium]|nr:hypothetical protein [Candidatus Falkowbacteria bacterium]